MTASNGTLTFSRPRGSKIFVNFLLDDTAGHLANFSKDAKAVATDLTTLRVNEIIGLEDICIASATGQTQTLFKKNGMVLAPLLNSQHLASVVTRPEPGFIFVPGDEITMLQVA
jgi:hypothetical protein